MVVYKSDRYQFALFGKTLLEYDEGHNFMLTCNHKKHMGTVRVHFLLMK